MGPWTKRPSYHCCLQSINRGSKAIISITIYMCLSYYPSQLVQFGEHDHDGGVVFPQHAPEVVGGDLQRSLGRDVSAPLSVPIYEVGVYII